MKLDDLVRLEKVARVKADLELRRYAALHRHALALDARVDALEAELRGAAAGWNMDAGWSESRLVNGLTRAMANESIDVQSARARMEAAHEAARQSATKAWGRAEALTQLRRRAARARSGGHGAEE